MTKTKKRAERPADAVYKTRLADVNERVATLQLLVGNHAVAQAKSPRDWGYAGDLEHLLRVLDEACAAVGGKAGDDRAGWAFNSDGKAVRVSIPKD